MEMCLEDSVKDAENYLSYRKRSCERKWSVSHPRHHFFSLLLFDSDELWPIRDDERVCEIERGREATLPAHICIDISVDQGFTACASSSKEAESVLRL